MKQVEDRNRTKNKNGTAENPKYEAKERYRVNYAGESKTRRIIENSNSKFLSDKFNFNSSEFSKIDKGSNNIQETQNRFNSSKNSKT